MPNSKKRVYFDHFVPYYLPINDESDSNEHCYNLSPLFQFINERPLSETKKNIFGEYHMVHKCIYHNDLHLWEIQMLHLREKILPGIADDNGGFELIQLEDNQYPAESTTLLYDELNSTVYMQRNLYGTSIKAMESFLQQLSPEEILVTLKPILRGSQITEITEQKHYRKVVLYADSEQATEDMPQHTLKALLNNFKHYQGKFVKIELGFGHKRNRNLDPHEVTTLVREAYTFSGTYGLIVSKAEDEDTAFETINLLDDRATFKLNVEFSRGNPITHERLYRMCLAECR